MPDLRLSPEVEWYLTDRGIPLPTCPPRWKTAEPREVPTARFDPVAVDRVLAAFNLLRHTQGEWAGRPLRPDPWEIAYVIAPVFGWVRYDRDLRRTVRVINNLYVELPRKNGKTTMVGAIGLYLTCADGEKGAQVVAAATTVNQAGYLFNPLKQLARSSPALKPHVKALSRRIIHPASGSYLEVVSSVAEALHGGNVHGGLVDELHVHKNPDLVEAIETGTGSRSQPLIVIITTADDGRPDTIYTRKREYVEKLSAGTITDPSTYGVIWCADAEDDPFAEATWRATNPGFGVSPTVSYMQRQAAKARQSPADLSAFLRLNLGVRTRQRTVYVELATWDRNAGMVTPEDLDGRPAWGGLDLASTSDLCSLCWDFPDGQGGHDLLWRHWCSEQAFTKLAARTAGAAEVWRRAGTIKVTPGDVTDYAYIRRAINADRERFRVRSIGYDPWNSSQLVTELVEDGAPMIKVTANYASLSGPLKQIRHLLHEGTARVPRYRHGGNPLMRWQTDNLAVAMDAAGNVKPDKARSGDKIDGWAAATVAMACVIAADPDRRSTYEDRGLVVL